ncbi:hypothetical protein [Agarilytica rhodophyticola]|uniref:hypothetical protein n=1 Tax=Agarilytica rhodophyticola TaxID=1737490 RepID=UPI0013150BE2|nr:hypothetical protein [Agarilytica rhodophyticola]
MQKEKQKENKSKMRINSVTHERRVKMQGFSVVDNREKIMQMAEIKTKKGIFKNTKYKPVVDECLIGADVKIEFKTRWDEAKDINAKKIALIQVVKQTKGSLQENLEPQHEQTTDENTGYRVDRVGGAANPIFGADDPIDGDILKTESYEYKDQGKYKIGKDITDSNKYPPRHIEFAELYDMPRLPRFPTTIRRSMEFEVAAIVIEGADKDEYLGSIKWGFTREEGQKVKMNKFEISTDSTPSLNYTAAAEKWNEQDKTLGREFVLNKDVTIEMKKKWINSTFTWVDDSREVDLREGTIVKRFRLSTSLSGDKYEIPVEWSDGLNAAWGYVKLEDLNTKIDSLSSPKAGKVPL